MYCRRPLTLQFNCNASSTLYLLNGDYRFFFFAKIRFQFSGTKNYTMTFKQTPPFIEPAFWALRMFDATNSYPVPNPINRYVLGSDYPEMKKNPDGSLTVYLQNKNPGKDKEANWLPAPAGPFLLILGTYAPGQAMIDSLSNPSDYIPPPAVVVK
jgi:hypothetical protein